MLCPVQAREIGVDVRHVANLFTTHATSTHQTPISIHVRGNCPSSISSGPVGQSDAPTHHGFNSPELSRYVPPPRNPDPAHRLLKRHVDVADTGY